MTMNCFYRPRSNAKVEYEYKTNVLKTYTNYEDRVAQRDIPRISFEYNFNFSSNKEMCAFDNELRNNGLTGGIFIPDWFSMIPAKDIIVGNNTVTVDNLINFAKGQYILIQSIDSPDYEVALVTNVAYAQTGITSYSQSLSFESGKSFSDCIIMPLYNCNSEKTNNLSSSNVMNNSVGIVGIVKDHIYVPIRDYSITFLGHDVLSDDFIRQNSDIQFKSQQEVMENDYDIGVVDRFTFYSRMYDEFSVKLKVAQDKLEYTRNFIRRRWGQTYGCFVASGTNDFTRLNNNGFTDTLTIKQTTHDFDARPYIAINYYNGGSRYCVLCEVTAHNDVDDTTVLTLDTSTAVTIVYDFDGNIIDYISDGGINIPGGCTTDIQSLLFARLDSDKITFSYAGTSADNSGLYSIDLNFVECDMYDSALIDYNTYAYDYEDRNTLLLINAYAENTSSADDVRVTNKANPITFGDFPNVAFYVDCVKTTDGEFDNPPTVKQQRFYGSIKVTTGDHSEYLIDYDDDFVLQVTGSFKSPVPPYSDCVIGLSNLYITGIYSSLFSLNQCCLINCIIINQTPYIVISVGDTYNSNTIYSRYYSVFVKKCNGNLFDDTHEFAIQRKKGIVTVWCDGWLQGEIRNLRHTRMGYFTRDNLGCVCFGWAPVDNTHSNHNLVNFEQFRIALNKTPYDDTYMRYSATNRIYRLDDYRLTNYEVFNDTATIFSSDMILQSRDGVYGFDTEHLLKSTFASVFIKHPYSNYLCTLADNDTTSYRNVNVTTSVVCNRNHAGYCLQNRNSNDCFGLIPNRYKMPFKWYKDFWLEFELSNPDDVELPENYLLADLDTIMPTVYTDSVNKQWKVGAFGLVPSGWYSWENNARLKVALSLDCRNNRVSVYINNNRVASTALTTLLTTARQPYINLYPLVFSRSYAIFLNRFRLLDCCPYSDDSYTDDDWYRGFYTTWFDIEFGRFNDDNFTTLRVKPIHNTHTFADVYGQLKDDNSLSFCKVEWSDGTRNREIRNPQGNTLYTVKVTDYRTNKSGYGWFFVHSGYTGTMCKSKFNDHEEPDYQGDIVHVSDFTCERYNWQNQQYEDYQPAMLNNSDVQVYDKYVKFLYGNDRFIDMTSDSGKSITTIYSVAQQQSHRLFNHMFIKQVEFTLSKFIKPPTYISDGRGYYNCNDHMLLLNTRFYSDSSPSSGFASASKEYANISCDFRYDSGDIDGSHVLDIIRGYQYENDVYAQNITTYLRMTKSTIVNDQQYAFSSGILTDTYSTAFEAKQGLLLKDVNVEKIHVVIEFDYDMVKTFNSSYQTNKNCWVLIATKYWINGKMYKTSDTLKSVSGLASSYKDFNWDDFPYGVGCKQFAESEDFLRKTMAHIGCFGRTYAIYDLDTSTGVGDIKIYDYAKYNKDFKVKL